MDNLKKDFESIYDRKMWASDQEVEDDVKFYSGPGSHINFIVDEFVDTINNFIKTHNISSIVDLGCGDFNIGKRFLVDKYIGVDVCEPLIEYNKKNYGSDNISFLNENAVDNQLPSSDMLIIKEVLQHLTIDEIKKLLKNNFSQYKYVIVADSRYENSSNPNCDIDLPTLRFTGREACGSGTFLDKYPFDYNVERLHKITKDNNTIMDISLISKK